MGENISCCGRDCYECRHFPHECLGCNEVAGRVFWLQYVDEVICPIYNCCRNDKRNLDCGLCAAHPCWRYDEEKIVPDLCPSLETITPKWIDVKYDKILCPSYAECKGKMQGSDTGMCGEFPCWGYSSAEPEITEIEAIETSWQDIKVG